MSTFYLKQIQVLLVNDDVLFIQPFTHDFLKRYTILPSVKHISWYGNMYNWAEHITESSNLIIFEFFFFFNVRLGIFTRYYFYTLCYYMGYCMVKLQTDICIRLKCHFYESGVDDEHTVYIIFDFVDHQQLLYFIYPFS